MDNRPVSEQVVSGLRICALLFLGFLTIVMFWGGIALITTPQRVSPNSLLLRGLSLEAHPIIAGWIFLLVSAPILFLTMERWVKVLPGFFAYSTVGALIMLISGRYNHIRVPWETALFLTLVGISTAAVSSTFQNRKLRVIDRISLMAWQACWAVAAIPKKPAVMYLVLATSLALLLIAWQADVIKRR
jgi:hypothetical protein